MSIGTIWNHRDFIERVYGKEDAIEFEQVVKKYQAEQIAIEQERIIKLLREKAKHLKQVSQSIAMDEYMSDEDAAVPENGAFALNEFADALIREKK